MPSANTIPVLQRTIALIQAVAAARTGVSMKTLSVSLRIPQATCYRIVRTLVQHHWLRENGRGEFLLAFGLAHLARSYAEVEHYLNLLEPALTKLADLSGLSVKVSLREGDQAVAAMRSEPIQVNSITSPVGTRFHLAIGAAGAVLLSQMTQEEIDYVLRSAPPEVWARQSAADVLRRIEEVRKDGLARELGQQHASIFAVAAPLRLPDGTTAALTLVGWQENFAGDGLRRAERHLLSGVAMLHDILKAATQSPASGKASPPPVARRARK